MNDTIFLKKFLSGRVRVWNEDGLSVESENLVVYTGGDIIAQLLAGNAEYQISHFYFGYENTAGTPTGPAVARTDTVAYFQGLVSPQDFIRASILQPTQLSASDGNHNSNVATFLAVTAASVGQHAVPFSVGSNSKVFTLGLVAAPTGTAGGDVLYARYLLPTALPAAGSGQISATWATEAN